MTTWVFCDHCEKVNRVSVDKARAAAPVCGSCRATLRWDGGPQEVSGTGLSKLTRSAEVPVVVDFWASWCGPCKAFAPVFEKVAREWAGRYVFLKVDTEAHSFAAQAHRIRSIPTLALFRGGVEVDRISGALPEAEFKRYLESRFTDPHR